MRRFYHGLGADTAVCATESGFVVRICRKSRHTKKKKTNHPMGK